MIKDIVVNLGLGSNDPTVDYAVSMAEIFEAHLLAGAADQIGRIGRRFDLIIVGQPDLQKSSADEVVDEGVLFESGRPVIFVPFIQKGGAKLDRVMICWDGGRAATRAVADSLPLLKMAKQVEVV